MNGASAASRKHPTSRRAASRLGRFAALLLLPFLATGCAVAHYFGPISGQVVDKETREPLEGAAVVAVYNTQLASPGGPVTEPAEWQEAKTDAKGAFSLPGRFVYHPKFGIGFFEGDPEIYVAKPGYGEYGYHPEATRQEVGATLVYALPRLKTREERRRWITWQPFEGDPTLPYFVGLLNEERVSLGLGAFRTEINR